jgi:hypothetical protein
MRASRAGRAIQNPILPNIRLASLETGTLRQVLRTEASPHAAVGERVPHDPCRRGGQAPLHHLHLLIAAGPGHLVEVSHEHRAS